MTLLNIPILQAAQVLLQMFVLISICINFCWLLVWQFLPLSPSVLCLGKKGVKLFRQQRGDLTPHCPPKKKKNQIKDCLAGHSLELTEYQLPDAGFYPALSEKAVQEN